METEAALAPSAAGGGGEEEARVRKPYTTTKLRQSWTDPEHDRFLEALHMFDRDWRKIEAFVGSKTVIQIRSHAQKYFLKVQKSGTGEHLPPPRPKRKAAHPYPHKASKKAQAILPQEASGVIEHGCVLSMDASAVATNPRANDAFPSRDHVITQCFSPRLPEAMPDFARVYNFLGSVFDPETSGHLQKLQEMDPIDAETVLVLMKNLSMNLSSPNFEAHRGLLSSHDAGVGQVKHESVGDLGSTHTLQLPLMVTTQSQSPIPHPHKLAEIPRRGGSEFSRGARNSSSRRASEFSRLPARSAMGGKRKAEEEPEVSDSDDEEMGDEEFEALKAESRARTDKEYSEMFARLGLRQDAGLCYSDDSSSDDDSDEDDE